MKEKGYLFRFQLLKLSIDVSAAVHNAHNRNSKIVVRWNIENKVIVHWHNTHIAATPDFSIAHSIAFRHLVKRCNCSFDTGELCVRILYRLQIHCNVSENCREVKLGRFGQNNGIIQTPNSLRTFANAWSIGIVRPAFASA